MRRGEREAMDERFEKMRLTEAALSAITISMCGWFFAGCISELGYEERFVTLRCGADCNHRPSEDGRGTATVEGVTGIVEVDVERLPQLTGEVYEVWLTGGNEDPMSCGRFNTDADGFGSLSAVLGDISTLTFERVLLTVEPEPDTSRGQSETVSIGGNL